MVTTRGTDEHTDALVIVTVICLHTPHPQTLTCSSQLAEGLIAMMLHCALQKNIPVLVLIRDAFTTMQYNFHRPSFFL